MAAVLKAVFALNSPRSCSRPIRAPGIDVSSDVLGERSSPPTLLIGTAETAFGPPPSTTTPRLPTGQIRTAGRLSTRIEFMAAWEQGRVDEADGCFAIHGP